jgi:hypothetical protein
MYASRALSQTEREYAQIEKELLAIVFGAERFNQYTYDRLVTVQTDHKSLEMIMEKALHLAPRRLQRMLMRLQKYILIVTYKKGPEIVLADALSRAHLTHFGMNNGDNEEILCTRSSVESEIEQIKAVDCSYISGAILQEIR